MPILTTTWASLTVIARLYLLFLLAYAAYATFFLIRALLNLRRYRPDDKALGGMNRRLETVRQANALLFLLFGVVFTMEMIATIRTVGFMAVSLSGATINIFGPPMIFALFAWVVITFLHILQWAVAARL